jgi:hypothetical protein
MRRTELEGVSGIYNGETGATEENGEERVAARTGPLRRASRGGTDARNNASSPFPSVAPVPPFVNSVRSVSSTSEALH